MRIKRMTQLILVAFVCTVLIASAVFGATSSSVKKTTPPSVKSVKGSIQLGPKAGQQLDDARKPRNTSVVQYIKTPGFKGAGIAPKGFVDLKQVSKADLELQAKKAKSSNKLAPGKYQSLIDSLKRNATTRR